MKQKTKWNWTAIIVWLIAFPFYVLFIIWMIMLVVEWKAGPADECEVGKIFLESDQVCVSQVNALRTVTIFRDYSGPSF